MSEFIDNLEVSTRTRRTLETLAVEGWGDLCALTQKKVRSIEHAGRKTWEEIADLQRYYASFHAVDHGLAKLEGLLDQVNALLRNDPGLGVVMTLGGMSAYRTTTKTEN